MVEEVRFSEDEERECALSSALMDLYEIEIVGVQFDEDNVAHVEFRMTAMDESFRETAALEKTDGRWRIRGKGTLPADSHQRVPELRHVPGEDRRACRVTASIAAGRRSDENTEDETLLLVANRDVAINQAAKQERSDCRAVLDPG